MEVETSPIVGGFFGGWGFFIFFTGSSTMESTGFMREVISNLTCPTLMDTRHAGLI